MTGECFTFCFRNMNTDYNIIQGNTNIIRTYVCKQYFRTIILYVMFLFSEDFLCQRRNSKQTLDSISVTAGINT